MAEEPDRTEDFGEEEWRNKTWKTLGCYRSCDIGHKEALLATDKEMLGTDWGAAGHHRGALLGIARGRC